MLDGAVEILRTPFHPHIERDSQVPEEALRLGLNRLNRRVQSELEACLGGEAKREIIGVLNDSLMQMEVSSMRASQAAKAGFAVDEANTLSEPGAEANNALVADMRARDGGVSMLRAFARYSLSDPLALELLVESTCGRVLCLV